MIFFLRKILSYTVNISRKKYFSMIKGLQPHAIPTLFPDMYYIGILVNDFYNQYKLI